MADRTSPSGTYRNVPGKTTRGPSGTEDDTDDSSSDSSSSSSDRTSPSGTYRNVPGKTTRGPSGTEGDTDDSSSGPSREQLDAMEEESRRAYGERLANERATDQPSPSDRTSPSGTYRNVPGKTTRGPSGTEVSGREGPSREQLDVMEEQSRRAYGERLANRFEPRVTIGRYDPATQDPTARESRAGIERSLGLGSTPDTAPSTARHGATPSTTPYVLDADDIYTEGGEYGLAPSGVRAIEDAGRERAAATDATSQFDAEDYSATLTPGGEFNIRLTDEAVEERVTEQVREENPELGRDDVSVSVEDGQPSIEISEAAERRAIRERIASQDDSIRPDDIQLTRTDEGYEVESVAGEGDGRRIPAYLLGDDRLDWLQTQSGRWTRSSDWVGSQGARPAGLVDDLLSADAPIVDESVYGATIGEGARPAERATGAVVGGVGRAADPFGLTYGASRLGDATIHLRSARMSGREEYGGAVGDVGVTGATVASGAADSIRTDPVEFGGTVVGGFALGGAATAGVRAARSGSAMGASAAGPTAGSTSTASSTITRVRSGVSEIRAQSPRARFVRDADAGLVDVSSNFRMRQLDTPSISTPNVSRQAIADSAFRARSRLVQDIRSTRADARYQLSRARDLDSAALPDSPLPSQQTVNDAAFRAGYRTQQNINRTRSDLRYQLSRARDTDLPGSPLPSQQAVNDAAFRTGYRTQQNINRARADARYQLSRLPDQEAVNDAAFRAGYRTQQDINRTIAGGRYYGSALRDAASPDVSAPSISRPSITQDAVNDAAFRAGYRFEQDVSGAMAFDRWRTSARADRLSEFGLGRPSLSRPSVDVPVSRAAASDLVSDIRTAADEYTLRIEPGRPARQDRTIDLSDVSDVSVGDPYPAASIDPVRGDRPSPASTDWEFDADAPSPSPTSGRLTRGPSQSRSPQAALREPELGLLARDPVDTLSSGSRWGDYLLGGAAGLSSSTDDLASEATATDLDASTASASMLETAQTPAADLDSSTRTEERLRTPVVPTTGIVSTPTSTTTTTTTTIAPPTTTTTTRPPSRPPNRPPRAPPTEVLDQPRPDDTSDSGYGLGDDYWDTSFADADEMASRLGSVGSSTSAFETDLEDYMEVRW